ncbi:hypothetical protein LEMLEM_LOCUS26729, partial [Lemmus lemmus]
MCQHRSGRGGVGGPGQSVSQHGSGRGPGALGSLVFFNLTRTGVLGHVLNYVHSGIVCHSQ